MKHVRMMSLTIALHFETSQFLMNEWASFI